MEFILKLVLVLAFALTFFPYFIFVYERLGSGGKINAVDLAFAFIKEFFSYIYIIFSWVFGFIPIENYVSRRGGVVKTPVFIIPGWMHTKAVILPLFFMLRARGFENIFLLSAQPFSGSVEEIAGACVGKIKKVLDILSHQERTIFLVGHSLGGLVAKYITENQERFDLKVKKCITVCAPHEGTKMAYFGFGKSAKEMIPGSELIEKLRDVRDPKVYFCIGSEEDQLTIPQTSAYIKNSEKITYRRSGHFTPIFSPSLADDILSILRKEEREKG